MDRCSVSELSIIIPAKNEIFLQNTIDDILKNIEADTEIIVILDGYWPDNGIPDHPRIVLTHFTRTVGQRAGTNYGVSLSRSKYVMKVDAHCAFDKGFDRKMLEAIKDHDDWTMVPLMKNLWAFDWICPDGHTRYQGPSGKCKECGKETVRDMKWIGKNSPQSRSFCFDAEPHFQYFREFNKRPAGQGEVTETMSLQGSCFMMTREKYLELGINDEKYGSWGSQGIEVACKTWLSGGKVMCNRNTWYAHMFRTQGGDFGFPYEIHGKDQDAAKKRVRDTFFNNKFPKAKYPLSWLIEKFWPVPGWTEANLAELKGEKVMKKSMVFFTDNQLNLKIAHAVQHQLRKIPIPLVSVSLKPMPHFGNKNIVVNLPRGYLAYFTQILEGIKACDAEIIYLVEHDVLYHPSHFMFIPPTKDKFYYNQNFWKVRVTDGFAAHWDANQVSGLVAYKELLVDWYSKRLEEITKDRYHNGMGFEPGKSGDLTVAWKSEWPNVDLRHGANLTKSKWSLDDFRDKSTAIGFITAWEVPGWGSFKGAFV